MSLPSSLGASAVPFCRRGMQEVEGGDCVRLSMPPKGVEYSRILRVPTSRIDALPADERGICVTLSYMGARTVTLRLDDALRKDLDALCRRAGRTRSQIVREALRRQMALLRFEEARAALLPLAEAQGFLTDEDVFRVVS